MEISHSRAELTLLFALFQVAPRFLNAPTEWNIAFFCFNYIIHVESGVRVGVINIYLVFIKKEVKITH